MLTPKSNNILIMLQWTVQTISLRHHQHTSNMEHCWRLTSNKKKFTGSPDLPIAITGDGVASNVKAGRILRILYGFNSPDYRCAAHIASGVAKRLTTSKTMNVGEVTELHNVLRAITKHFESSINK